MSDYSIFIKGETIDLCVPSTLAIERDDWADWFNDLDTTRFLSQGDFPNMKENQYDFYESLRRRERLGLLIKAKKSERVFGIVALSFINFQTRNAELTIALGMRDDTTKGRLFALEAWALIAAHGFEILGLDRIHAHQAWPGLKRFNRKLELLGFRAEGIIRKGFVKGRTIQDVLLLSCLYETYTGIKDVREGKYWPGEKRMKELIDNLPDKGWTEQMDEILKRESENYFSHINFS